MNTLKQFENALMAKESINFATTDQKNHYLKVMAQAIADKQDQILAANQYDLDLAKGTISPVMLDRLTLTPQRIQEIIHGILQVVKLDDPIGSVHQDRILYNGLHLTEVAVPFGVIGVIYESRPNVTADVAALCVKSGNVAILRGGKEAYHTSQAMVEAMRQGLVSINVNPDIIQLIQDTSRQSAMEMMKAKSYLDLLIPRGGAGLIKTVVEESIVPVIETGTGICHIFVDASADIEQALKIIDNAKTTRPSVCNALEVLLIHQEIAGKLLPELENHFSHPVELRADEQAKQLLTNAKLATSDDFTTEFSDYILAVKIVGSVDEAIIHINQHSTGHSDAILSQDSLSIQRFTQAIDSSAVYVNASTRFTDGGEFGLGCEVGISTQKLHARGPMGLEALTSRKNIIVGSGQIR